MVNFSQLPRIAFMALALSGVVAAEPASPDNTPAGEPAYSKEGHHGHCPAKKEYSEQCDHLLPNCSHSKSVHDYVIFFPILGPFFDLATIADKDELKWWELPLSVAIPVFGPGITRTLGTRTCVDHAPHAHGHGHEHAGKDMKHEPS